MINKLILKKNFSTNELELVRQDGNLNLIRRELGAYVLNGFNTDTENKLFVLSDSSINKDTLNERVIKITVNDIDSEINIECRVNGVLTDVIGYVYLFIEVYDEPEYTDEELSTILFAQSVLVKKGFRAEASKIGAPIPPKKP